MKEKSFLHFGQKYPPFKVIFVLFGFFIFFFFPSIGPHLSSSSPLFFLGSSFCYVSSFLMFSTSFCFILFYYYFFWHHFFLGK